MSHPTPSGADNSRSIFLCFMVLRCLVTVCCRFPQTTPPATAHCTNQRRQGDGTVSQWALQGQDGLTIMKMSKSPGLVLGHENVCLEPPECCVLVSGLRCRAVVFNCTMISTWCTARLCMLRGAGIQWRSLGVRARVEARTGATVFLSGVAGVTGFFFSFLGLAG